MQPKTDMIDLYTTELWMLCRGFEPLFLPRKGGMIDLYTNTAYGMMFLSTYNDFVDLFHSSMAFLSDNSSSSG